MSAARGPTRIQAATGSFGSLPNVIAGSGGTGVLVENAGINSLIDGNTIGDDNAPANGGDGVNLAGSQASVTNNTIDHNTKAGVRIGGVSANQNVVTGNRIGLSDSDSGAGNGDEGVRIENDASSDTIGGPAELDANTVSENGDTGIFA
ncbi:MAG TPA: right-handed parallel beta-helix repeat-containing protein [Solirubrobacteraceae bacterium]|nr:right-handed parallel beta-helix repeat-containing protein [Solirubrobacteraceae bacterium]